jgi:hypothetical protein|uniref:Uncharacterized protein n=1 Tax=Sipha flava TaxID=143950 RepID=A0A2S2QNN1_9HEMI
MHVYRIRRQPRWLINYTLGVAFVSSAVVTDGLLLFVHDQRKKINNNNNNSCGTKIKHSAQMAAQDYVLTLELSRKFVRNSIVFLNRESGRAGFLRMLSGLPR